jgi:hypothetical protein
VVNSLSRPSALLRWDPLSRAVGALIMSVSMVIVLGKAKLLRLE